MYTTRLKVSGYQKTITTEMSACYEEHNMCNIIAKMMMIQQTYYVIAEPLILKSYYVIAERLIQQC